MAGEKTSGVTEDFLLVSLVSGSSMSLKGG